MTWGTVELEAEVRDWLEGLSTAHFATAAFYVDLLTEQGPLLSEPYTRQLDGKLREFHLDGDFRKTRMREDREVNRARRALRRCISEAHTVESNDGSERDV
jgi:hypothetical protein